MTMTRTNKKTDLCLLKKAIESGIFSPIGFKHDFYQQHEPTFKSLFFLK